MFLICFSDYAMSVDVKNLIVFCSFHVILMKLTTEVSETPLDVCKEFSAIYYLI